MTPVMSEYVFYWRRKFFWKSKKVKGHGYQEEQDKMILYYPDGGIREIKRWKDCECKLKVDWVVFTKDKIKEESGQG